MNAPDWCTLAITGPQDLPNGHGQSWSGYWATLGPARSGRRVLIATPFRPVSFTGVVMATERRQRVHHPDCLQGEGDDAGQQLEDVARIADVAGPVVGI